MSIQALTFMRDVIGLLILLTLAGAAAAVWPLPQRRRKLARTAPPEPLNTIIAPFNQPLAETLSEAIHVE